jgi:glycosyl transferase family 87
VKTGATWMPVAAAFGVRLAAILVSDRVVADVLRYRRVAAHVLDVSWNPYQAQHLYPYPPVWVWVEAACEWLARHFGLSFAVLVKLPVLAAEVAIVALLARWGATRGGAARWAPWIYALHPVAVLVSGFHGQFDSLALLMVLIAVRASERGRHDDAALALAAGIAVKSFPVLAVPALLLRVTGSGARVRFLALALLPVAVLLVPYLAHDANAVARELFGYGGVADFGWIGAWRGLRWVADEGLARGEARFHGALVPLAKVMFLVAYAAVAGRMARRDAITAILAVFVAFETFYGALSAQYLLWVIPLAVLRPDRWLAIYTVFATMGLVGFYLFLAPGVLTASGAMEGAGPAWVAGAVLIVAASASWLVALARNDSQLGQGTEEMPRRNTTD